MIAAFATILPVAFTVSITVAFAVTVAVTAKAAAAASTPVIVVPFAVIALIGVARNFAVLFGFSGHCLRGNRTFVRLTDVGIHLGFISGHNHF